MKLVVFIATMICFAVPGTAEEHLEAGKAQFVAPPFGPDDLLSQLIQAAASPALSDVMAQPRVTSGLSSATRHRLSISKDADFRSFAEDCAEMKVIPFKTFSAGDERRVMFGVNFDGIVGFYAFTK